MVVLNRLRAKDIMTAPVITVQPETPIAEVARILTEHHISGVPVVDDQKRLVGILTEADLLLKEAGPRPRPKLAFLLPTRTREAREGRRRFEGKVAGDVMTREVITATPETPVRELAASLLRHRINRIPIVHEGKVAGIVTRNDVLKPFSRPDETLHQEVLQVVLHDLWIDPRPLDIRVEHGVVGIRGQVERKSEIALVEKFARAIDGVVGVDVSGLTCRFDDPA